MARQASTAQTRTTVSGASVTQKSKAAAEAKATKAAQTQAKAAAQAKARAVAQAKAAAQAKARAAAQAKARAAAQAKKLVPPRAVHTGCFPKTNGGNCYEPGEFCRKSDRGLVGIAGDHVAIVCRDNDGLRWEPR